MIGAVRSVIRLQESELPRRFSRQLRAALATDEGEKFGGENLAAL